MYIILEQHPLYVCSALFSHVQLFVTLWTHQAPLSMGLFRQEYGTGLPFPSPGFSLLTPFLIIRSSLASFLYMLILSGFGHLQLLYHALFDWLDCISIHYFILLCVTYIRVQIIVLLPI